ARRARGRAHRGSRSLCAARSRRGASEARFRKTGGRAALAAWPLIGFSRSQLEKAAGSAQSGCDRAPREDQLGDLDAVEGGALADVVAREVEHEAVLRCGVSADAADQRFVRAGRLAGSREVDEPD